MYKTKIEAAPLVSVNNKYTGGFRLSPTYRKSKEYLIDLFQREYKGEPMEGPIQVSYVIECYADIDNFDKILFDCLEKAGVIQNDRHIHKVSKMKIPIKRGHDKTLHISVTPLTDTMFSRELRIIMKVIK